MAQRILKVKNHVLTIGRTQYPLEVTLYAAELSPDEVLRGHEPQLLPHTLLCLADSSRRELHSLFSS